MRITAKSASSTAPIEIPTIAPVDNLINNRSVQLARLTTGKYIPDPELHHNGNDVSSMKLSTQNQSSHLFCNEAVV